MPHIPRRYQYPSVKTVEKTTPEGTTERVHPPPSSLAPQASQQVQPDLLDIFSDIPFPDTPRRKKPDVERRPVVRGRAPKLGQEAVSVKNFTVSPAEVTDAMDF